MQESFLHFIWKHQKFDFSHLRSTQSLPIEVFNVGLHNQNEGPDFLNSKLSLNGVVWYGNIEIHTNSSDWNRHGHHMDPKYNNVILHVVWNHDRDSVRADGEILPVLELKNRVNESLWSRYKNLTNNTQLIPCQDQIGKIREIDKLSMLDFAGIERLHRKSSLILDLLSSNNGSWEETVYQIIAQNFGFKKNSGSMMKLARVLPHKLLLKEQKEIKNVEALIFGMAGFLSEGKKNDYVEELFSRFEYLSHKYGIFSNQMLRIEWDFLRMRPANFPTVRLAQMASFFHHRSKFFQTLIHHEKIAEVKEMFDNEVSSYWKQHYDFGKKSTKNSAHIGDSSIDVLLINVAAPVLATYSRYVGSSSYLNKAVEMLSALRAERNRIITDWKEMNVPVKSAFDSQALLELRNEFCLKKKCLSCKIGLKLISN